MRKLALTLAVVAAVGLSSGMALAAGPVHSAHPKSNIQLVAHCGPHGPYHHHGWYGPPVYRPRVIAPVPVYPRVVTPPVYGYPYDYGYPYYYYGPSRTFQYYGPGGGISIGW